MTQHSSTTDSNESLLFSSGHHAQGEMTLTQELINFADEFNEFVCVNSFISESLAALVSEQGTCASETALGAKYCAESIRARSMSLKAALKCCCDRQIAEEKGQ